MPFSIRVPVTFDMVFPHGALGLGVDTATDFDRRGQADDQMRDKESGQRLWVVSVIDNDPEATRFGRSAELKVRVASPTMPVLPDAQFPGIPPLVEFEGLMLTPYVDKRKCKAGDRCGSRQGYSMRASGLLAPGTSPV